MSESASALPAPRAFGTAPDDLNLDFEASDRPAVTTRLIARCCADAGDRARIAVDEHELFEPPLGASSATKAEIAWSMPLGARIARVLRIVELTTESDALGVVLTCPCGDCRSRFEVSLPFAALAVEPHDEIAPKIVPFPTPDGKAIALRLPTGRDQAQWRAQPYGTAEEAVRAILQTLAVNSEAASTDRCRAGSPVPAVANIARERDGASTAAAENEHDERFEHQRSEATLRATAGFGDPALHPIAGIDLAALSAAMEAADPLVAFSVRTTCPQCEQPAEIAVDLEAVALSRLRQHQRALVRTVHVLATRYGWSEAEVLAIPARRRSEYLRLIEDENPTLP